ncbi:hypothetical protein QCN27_15660, partial [Cereibacter sp. SYSU M97828]|nr:hypothetical protein [Cereibacter flavus]
MTLPEFFAATAFAGVVFPAIATATALSYHGTSAWLVRRRRRRWTDGKEEPLFGWDDSRLPWPTPDDLRAFYLTGAGGIVMDGMPEEITVTADGRRGAPIPYRRADVADRIRRREQSSPNFYIVGEA